MAVACNYAVLSVTNIKKKNTCFLESDFGHFRLFILRPSNLGLARFLFRHVARRKEKKEKRGGGHLRCSFAVLLSDSDPVPHSAALFLLLVRFILVGLLPWLPFTNSIEHFCLEMSQRFLFVLTNGSVACAAWLY